MCITKRQVDEAREKAFQHTNTHTLPHTCNSMGFKEKRITIYILQISAETASGITHTRKQSWLPHSIAMLLVGFSNATAKKICFFHLMVSCKFDICVYISALLPFYTLHCLIWFGYIFGAIV